MEAGFQLPGELPLYVDGVLCHCGVVQGPEDVNPELVGRKRRRSTSETIATLDSSSSVNEPIGVLY